MTDAGPCVPVSGFYEWRRPAPENGNVKQPFYFHRPDSGLLVFAGLWDLWLDAGTAASAQLHGHHDHGKQNDGAGAPSHARSSFSAHLGRVAAARPVAPGAPGRTTGAGAGRVVDAYPVGEEVNKAGNDGPELIEPRALQQLAFGLVVQPPLLTVADAS